jgi:hypothetical protein
MALFSAHLNAQLLSETFDTEIPATWTIIDVGGLVSITAQAEWASFAHNSGSLDACSSSWYDNAGAGPTNDWLITPAISIPLTGTYGLKYFGSSHEASYLEEYEVLVSTTGTDPADFVTTLLSVTNEPLAGVTHLLSLVPFAGETIYIAFHHTSNDESMLHLDNIIVDEFPANDIALVSISTPPVVEAGTVNITGTVLNNGLNPISSFDLDWNDGVAHSATITASIPAGGSYNFTHPTALTALGGTIYDLTVCATIVGDGDASNNCTDYSVSCVTEVPQKYVVGEERTGTWCGWCPRGAVALEDMESEEFFIGIAVHNGDPMTITAYDSGINAYIPPSFPGGAVDRVIEGDPGSFSSMYATRSSHIPPASIDVSYAVVGSNIEVTVTANFVGNLTGDYRLAAVITEDDVTGTASGYNQANYYSGGGAGAMGGYESLSDPVPAADMHYDHVARALGDNQILGTPGSLPASIAAGTSESFTYIIPKGADWNMDWLHFVGMLVDGTTGEILNAGITTAEPSGINEESAEFGLAILPNPSSNLTYLQVNLLETSTISIEIYNNLGELVFVEQAQNLAQGNYNYTIDVTNFAAGLYTVKTTVNGTVQTDKLSVVK